MSRSPARWRIAFAVSVAAQLAVLYWPRTVGAGGLPHLDKVVHAAVFAAVAATGLLAWAPQRRVVAVVLAALVAHAAASEVVQAVVLPGRSGDVRDVVADLVGVALGVLVTRRVVQASWRGERTS